jgi:mRNA interferase RelE/StbE
MKGAELNNLRLRRDLGLSDFADSSPIRRICHKRGLRMPLWITAQQETVVCIKTQKHPRVGGYRIHFASTMRQRSRWVNRAHASKSILSCTQRNAASCMVFTNQPPAPSTMFQVNFSEQSMYELNQLDTRSQMLLVEVVSTLTQEQLDNPNEDLGRFHRDGKTYYRVRAGEFRIYFEQQATALYAHYILHRNTFADFAFRSKLPVTEDFLVEQEDSFWKYLDSLRHKDDSKA